MGLPGLLFYLGLCSDWRRPKRSTTTREQIETTPFFSTSPVTSRGSANFATLTKTLIGLHPADLIPLIAEL